MLQKPKIYTVFKTVNSIVTTLSAPSFLRPVCAGLIQLRTKRGSSKDNVSSLFTPIQIKPNPDDINVGAELTGNLNKADLLKVLNKFYQNPSIKHLLTENGLDIYLQHQAYVSFRRYCLEANTLPVDLHVVVSDILQGAGNHTDIFPYFLRHAKQMFPHLECMDDLKKISDLRSPANWYPEARALNRKIIFHAGPTNSGKTYHALERYITAKSGVYCGPLKLLASEVFNKCNGRGTPCDLVTGEERKFADPLQNPSAHVACTVEMTSVTNPYEVAVIDEIQMIRDPQRGWAWTRALLGLMAEEVHLCGEAGAVNLVSQLCLTTGEDIEVRNYKRLTDLKIENQALGSLESVKPGDCIVCFSKNDIYSVSRKIENIGKEVAVIYGGLPPGTKLAQAAKFNDPENSCKILVATDAIGMGLNLSIRRVIFYSLIKPTMNEKGEKEMDTISVSQALQIAGRAGRYGTKWEQGFVTTFKTEDLPTLKTLMASQPEPLTQAGLHPTAEQIELYAYHLPNSTLSNLMDIFVNLCTVDNSLYFMCNIDDFKFLADMIQHVPLPLRARYVFCCSPINKKMPFVCTMFLKFTRQFSKNEPITFDWLCSSIGWPLQPPRTILDLVHLEAVFDVLDLYLWLSYRFVDLFNQADLVRDMQKELDQIIQQGVVQLTRLLQNSETDIQSSPVGKGRLTQRLLAQGILTPDMLSELKKEWNRKEELKASDSDEDPSPPKTTVRRKRKTTK
ncbi:ATP-dependent RNA helicase SUV3 homolog, mitochondrial-like isoform X2 [Dendroctonus ponderosae]|uniref:ATP-dependent RNA helicase SUV3 homolog, mitochondrial isoform X2 n=1 Tax=Dendroctonus ponderosae TaxID=77166 RepID=UPI0020364E34|nr:ATP-dependent RNA helicase SUV3 homolog, mitochondrial isoform X2 [Dendroctonus ponderosae]XP_048523937.1 ATP-dependent RNA helicase SUV3 homolog, mitochondrial-like isoform X2 [Dendroctonus ponderosae]XP_048523947.1 ATP-dependent RNA helicase SUV3 homolog, mitochondrial-like isoform X2 [Dendroctonus ponderosae]XP_048524398.1 ATP-dependent RNA helicase SUV3 homolog, mitochondrial-like isoform X2 [Dendroctonus ponderosae]